MIPRAPASAQGLDVGRRRFVQGLAMSGGLTALGWPQHYALAAMANNPILSGTDFRLEIGPVPVNITGYKRR